MWTKVDRYRGSCARRRHGKEARILRPLVWFGLLESLHEHRSATELVEPRFYRKAPLFDRFLKFDIQIEGSDISH
jgi:hypothetical protein